MKAVLMSIRPKWCEKIFRGEKTIEVRKTAFKSETPFKVYVYCTKERMTRVPSMNAYLHKNEPKACAEYGTIETWSEIGDVIVNPHLASKFVSFGMHGKVIGEFVCDRAKEYRFSNYEARYNINDVDLMATCLNHPDFIQYGKGKTLCGLHITSPKCYDTPKELYEFTKACDFRSNCGVCTRKKYLIEGGVKNFMGCDKHIYRAPSSWCYVEEVVE